MTFENFLVLCAIFAGAVCLLEAVIEDLTKGGR